MIIIAMKATAEPAGGKAICNFDDGCFASSFFMISSWSKAGISDPACFQYWRATMPSVTGITMMQQDPFGRLAGQQKGRIKLQRQSSSQIIFRPFVVAAD